MPPAQEPTAPPQQTAALSHRRAAWTDASPFVSVLRGRPLIAARLAWAAVTLLSITILCASLWVAYSDDTFSLLPEFAARVDIALYRVFTNNQFLSSTLLLVIAFSQTVAFVGVGVIIFARRSDDWLIILTSAMLIATGVGFSPNVFLLPVVRPEWWLPVTVLHIVLFSSLVVFLFVFPNGRFVPSWARWISLAWVLYAVSWLAFPELNPHQTSSPAALFFFIAVVMLGTAAQIYRYRRNSGPVERQQSKWVLVGFLTTNLCFFVLVSLSVMGITPRLETIAPVSIWLMNTVLGMTAVLIPITIGVAILRYRLWDIDLFINRALVYGALSGLLLGLYIVVVGGLGALFQSGNSLVLAILATGLIAVLFNPVHQRLQQAVNRLMYGDRDDPLTLVTRLGRRLEDTVAPEEVPQVLVETIAEAMKLPYVGLSMGPGGREQIVAETGERPTDVQQIPLVSQSELVGYLLAASRPGQDSFPPAELRLLDTIAHQAGTAVYAAQLNANLRHSREQLVLAQEEERRRLQRDLHDRLGPQLAALTMELEVAQRLVSSDPQAAVALLARLQSESQATIGDIRRLVYELRPPVLDQLGLRHAIGELAAGNTHPGGPRLIIDIPSDLPALPAAVETAAYRITAEAIANCLRHASATECRVDMCVDGGLSITITDNGRGLPDPIIPGVGLNSVRERAAELGGRVTFHRPATDGTVVEVNLPLNRDLIQ